MLSGITEKFYLFASERIAKKFYEKRYERILKVNKTMYGDRIPSVVYRNLFRILSLFEMGRENWKTEYGIMLRDNQLSVLGDADEFYIRMFMLEYTRDLVDVEGVLDLEEVSRRTKKLFPIDFNTDPFNKVALKK